MIHHVSSYIELMIAYDGINRTRCNELIFIDGMGGYCYVTYVYNIMIMCEYSNTHLYSLLFIICRCPIILVALVLTIANYGTNNEMCNEIKCIDDKGECCYAI